ncbi:hypothetical protein NEMBOFW57_002222 [Staphylotrichum longicolle]|uniref:Nucleotide exchange factor SIL1 n=1 Tax=Staphylotrichum longicolle TaxID=669026 RepID=A0AAD4I1K3_9PEZI|nr:hypothetical protein NEMBOFW57_002222 [Staphylotrichum longicolle]
MAKFRLKMLPLNLLALIGLMAWGASASAGESAPSPSPSPSPSADVELICHTDNPAECYPKIFQPTDEFQIVRPDQDLPLGLHVRLNVQTGEKEAKINVPDEQDPALAGLPVDSSIVIVEPDQPAEPAQQPAIPRNAPAYDAAGKIKTPKPAPRTPARQRLLQMLEDISHDIYYGLKIAEDYDTNNPKALASLEAHWPALGPHLCPSTSTPSKPPSSPSPTPPPPTQNRGPGPGPALTKARTALLSNLLRSPTFRAPFLSSGGPSALLRLLVSEQTSAPAAWDAAQRTAAFLLLDNFLDADMGAALGEWPPAAAVLPKKKGQGQGQGQGQVEMTDEEGEEGRGRGGEEACLSWVVGRLKERAGKEGEGHWSGALWRN